MPEKNYFSDYVGQSQIVGHHNRVLNAVEHELNVPLKPLEYTGLAGLGKTSYARLFGNKLTEITNGEFEFIELSSGITLPAFVQQWVDLIEGKRAVILIDEAQGLQNVKVKNLLKRLLETENSVRTIQHEEYQLTANPFQHQYIFATNEEPRDSALFGPTGRTKQMQFLPYSREESIAIMKLKASKWEIDLTDAGAEYLVDRVLPNGRAISELIENDALLFVVNTPNKRVTLDTAKQIVQETGRFPRGLRRADIVTLLFIGKDEKGKQVQEIAAAAGGEDKRTTSYRLQWLAGLNFIRTASNGRKVLTQDGMDYLAKLRRASARRNEAAATTA
jgi:Holliday junction resolvasome RuvABC ATP-dependent DNA helicase subunit